MRGEAGIQDDIPTVVDGVAPASARRPATRHDAAEHTPATHASTLVPRPETVLRDAEVAQSRRLAIAGMIFNVLGLVTFPLFGGDPLARHLYIAGLVGAFVNNARLFHVTREGGPYRQSHLLLYIAVAAVTNGAIIYFLGVFGPILVIFVLNVCMTCLAFDRRVSRATLVGAILPVLTLGGAMALGLIRDPGLMTVLPWVGDAGRGLIVAGMTGFLIMTYGQARRARDVIVASLAERDEAVRMASQREAMFLEARFDLERALQVGGLGRFSDQVLGSYQLGEVIGRGGMGEVYRAQHVETGAAAAVKMLLPEVLARPDYVRRFLEEVRIAASLHSPHVVEVLEVGDASAPLPYLAMELLEGEDLAQQLRREGRLEIDAVVALVRQVGAGLRAANEAGIVHRDLKPQNLFEARRDGDRAWKILDFGVSKLMAGGASLTEGAAVGTPNYMAPEQARGDVLDGRADLYGLGAVAYRALTGQPPFKGGRAASVLLRVLKHMPARPSELVDVHPDVDRVMGIALAKRRDDRFDDADALADALEAAARGALSPTLRERADALLAKLDWSPM